MRDREMGLQKPGEKTVSHYPGGAAAVTVEVPWTPKRSNDEGSLGFRMQFALRAHEYILTFLGMADQKAAFVFALVTSVIAVLYHTHSHMWWIKWPLSTWSFYDGLSFLSFLFLTVSGGAAFFAFLPRSSQKKADGLIYWESVAGFDQAYDYVRKVSALSETGLVQEILDNHYRLSKACRAKNRWLTWAVWTCGAGVFLSVWVLLFRPVPPEAGPPPGEVLTASLPSP